MENDIFDSLGDLGYDGPLSDPDAFSKAIDDGLKSLDFIKLVCELAEELKMLCKVEESVNMINSLEETSSFMLELSSFLKELGCPYRGLISGHMSSRLQTKEIRVTLLDYLISEIMAARMVSVDCPNENQPPNMDIVMQESPTAKALKEILIALKFNKPPPNITPEVLFSKLEVKLKDTIQKEGQQLVGKPLYNKALTEKDWKELDNIFTEMYDEYRLRRETLISRLECTIQSFEWSDRLKGKKDQIQAIYRPKREQMKVKPEVKLCDFLAARTSLLHVDKTSSANVRKNTQSEVNKVIIGQVPDRGGRPNEQQPPPPEMPSWQQRSAPQGGRGGGGQRGGRGMAAGVADVAGEGVAGYKAATTRDSRIRTGPRIKITTKIKTRINVTTKLLKFLRVVMVRIIIQIKVITKTKVIIKVTVITKVMTALEVITKVTLHRVTELIILRLVKDRVTLRVVTMMIVEDVEGIGGDVISHITSFTNFTNLYNVPNERLESSK